jgi:hypothetical protein
LNEKFVLNERERQPYKVRVKNTIDLLLIKNSTMSLESLVNALKKESIQTVLRQNKEGVIYGITYIDHRTKSVFNGSALGKQYSANGLQERCSAVSSPVAAIKDTKGAGEEKIQSEKRPIVFQPSEKEKSLADNNLLETLMNPKEGFDYVPWQLKKSKRKKRKGISK